MIHKSGLLIGICILILAGAGAFAVHLTFDSRIYRVTVAAPPDWLTYRNDAYGFELKYPKNWSIRESKGFGSPLFIELKWDPQKFGIVFKIDSPAEPIAQKIAAWRTRDDFISDDVFETAHLRGRRVITWDSYVRDRETAYLFTKPGTNIVFLAAIDRESRSPEMDNIFSAILASVTFH